MKPASAGLIAYLRSNAARTGVYADVITVYLQGGTDETYRLRWTTAQQDISEFPLDGDPIRRTWRSRDVIVSGLRARASIGTKVDEQSMTLNFAAGYQIQGVAAKQAILQGALDGALVRRDRYYYAAWGEATQGGAPKFRGFVGSVTALGRMDATLKVNSGLVLLDQPMPRHLVGPTCNNRVYDPSCGLDQAAEAIATTVAAGATTTTVPLALPSVDYRLGRIFFEDLGVVRIFRAIKDSDGVGVKLFVPLPAVPAAGENVTIVKGCDRTHDGGCTMHANTARFRGFRFVPQADKAL